jgi:hypothetical protein
MKKVVYSLSLINKKHQGGLFMSKVGFIGLGIMGKFIKSRN